MIVLNIQNLRSLKEGKHVAIIKNDLSGRKDKIPCLITEVYNAKYLISNESAFDGNRNGFRTKMNTYGYKYSWYLVNIEREGTKIDASCSGRTILGFEGCEEPINSVIKDVCVLKMAENTK